MASPGPLTYKLVGSLYLPDPTNVVSESRMKRLLELQPILDEFDRRPARQPTFNVDVEFLKFHSDENEVFPDRDPVTIIRPSGWIGAPISLQLHYPTFIGANLEQGETAEITSPCPRLLLTAGFDAKKTFWFDTFARRENSPFVPAVKYNDEQLAVHLDWSRRLLEEASAKVHIVFGDNNKKYILKELEGVLEEFTLWDDAQTPIYIQFMSSQKTQIKRVIMFSYHPQFFFNNFQDKYSRTMDLKLAMACSMANFNRSEKESTYFTWRANEEREKFENNAKAGKVTSSKKDFKKRMENDGDIEAIKRRKDNKGTGVTKDFMVFPPNRNVEVVCRDCDYRMLDMTPAFWKTDTRFYIACRRTCKGCDSKSANFIPQDTSIPWMAGSSPWYLKRSVEDTIAAYEKWMVERYPEEPMEEYLEAREIGPDDEFLEQHEEWYRDFELEEIFEKEAALPSQGPAVFW